MVGEDSFFINKKYIYMKTIKDNPETDLPNSQQPRGKHRITVWNLIKNHPTISALLLGVLATTIVLIWKNTENSRQKASTIALATKSIEENQLQLVKIVAKPLVWSIRSEMLRGNMEQVNILISDMVKEKNFNYIHIIAPDGNVILSTNKSLEGKLIGNEVDPTLLVIDTHPMAMFSGKTIIVTSPIMGIDRKLATLVLGYTTVAAKFQ
jgi:hypothetical protein